ncbi:hypothetical protein COO60DRAFT_1634841 [Scenedesmus sp. NREL 46B-D3]|nr:hypothetical protein COO60DRAFT_1634841 [Scenedesmus sp. NREL 46B-D3]
MADGPMSYRQFLDGLLRQLTHSRDASTAERRVKALSSSTRDRAAPGPSSSANESGYSSMKEMLLANQHVWPELVAPLLLVLQQGEAVDDCGQFATAQMFSIITKGDQRSAEQQAVLQQLVQQLPQLLEAMCLSRRMGLVLAAVQKAVERMREADRRVPVLVKQTLVWVLWEPAVGQLEAAAGLRDEISVEVPLPAGCTLHWPPGNVQLLDQPELLECMLVLAARTDSVMFALKCVKRVVAASVGAPWLSPSACRAWLLQSQCSLQVLRRLQQQQVAGATGGAAEAAEQDGKVSEDEAGDVEAGAVTLASDAERLAYISFVQLQCIAPMSSSRGGLLVLAPHAHVLRQAAALLQRAPAAEALQLMQLTVQQVAASKRWARQAVAAAAAALEETKAQHADAAREMRCIITENVAPARNDRRSLRSTCQAWGSGLACAAAGAAAASGWGWPQCLSSLAV